jgi:hypothetical protein
LAQNARFVSDLRTAVTAYELYAAERNAYPVEVEAGILPAGMQVSLARMDWTGVNSLGGRWDLDCGVDNTIAQITTHPAPRRRICG